MQGEISTLTAQSVGIETLLHSLLQMFHQKGPRKDPAHQAMGMTMKAMTKTAVGGEMKESRVKSQPKQQKNHPGDTFSSKVYIVYQSEF